MVSYLKLRVLFLIKRCCMTWTLNTVHDDKKSFFSASSDFYFLQEVMRNFINVFIIANKSTWTIEVSLAFQSRSSLFSGVSAYFYGLRRILSNCVSLFGFVFHFTVYSMSWRLVSHHFTSKLGGWHFKRR